MDSVRIDILNPKAKKLLEALETLDLIAIKKPDKSQLKNIVHRLRKKSGDLSFDEISQEVEAVRSRRYGEEK